MHPSIALMLRSQQNRAIAARILARLGNRSDTMLAHINPAEALILEGMGGSGTINPKTGLRQFDPTGGSNAGGAQHAGDSGHMGGMGGDGGGGKAGGADEGGAGAFGGSGHAATGNDANAGFRGAGSASGNGGGYGPGSGSGGYTGTHASGPGFGQGPTNSPSGGYGQYGSNGGYTGGVTINPGRSLVSLGLGAIPGIGPILSAANSMFGPTIGPSLNIGGTTNGYAIDGNKTGVYGLGLGSGGPNNAGSNVGANGGGQHDGVSRGAVPGSTAPGSGGTVPAPGAQPAGLPPIVNPALAGLYFGGLAGDPFAGRFGANPYLSPYLIAANQPAAPGYLGGLWR